MVDLCISTFKDMTKKEVINICDGKKLGNIFNCDIDISTNKILSYLVKERKVEIFPKREKVYKVYVKDIRKIGNEIVLVDNVRTIDSKC